MASETYLPTKDLTLKLACGCGTSLVVPVEHLPKVFDGNKGCPTCSTNWDFQSDEISPYVALAVVVDHLEKLDGVDVSFGSGD